LENLKIILKEHHLSIKLQNNPIKKYKLSKLNKQLKTTLSILLHYDLF